MSVQATTRAWESGASGTDLLVLLALADVAGGEDDPYAHSYPSVERLERMTKITRRTVQRALRALEEAGTIKRTGTHHWGRGKVTNCYRIEGSGGANATGRHPDAASGEVPGGASPGPPNPPTDPSIKEDARAKPPPNFPDELRPHAREVMRILVAVAEQHGCRKVWPLAVGRAIMAKPRHPLVEVAHDLAGWSVDPPHPITDVVATYRTFLKRARVLEATERLSEDGTPDATPKGSPGNVTPIRGGRYDARAAKADREASREAAARRLLAQQQEVR